MKYVEYNGIDLYSKEAMDYCGYPLNPDYEIFPGYYLKPCNLDALTKAIKLEELGTFDFAVPQSWSEENNYPKGLDQAVWFYPARSKIFGEPLTVRQMLDLLRERIKQEALEYWLECESEFQEQICEEEVKE